MSTVKSIKLDLLPEDTELLSNLCGPFNEHLKQIEKRLSVEIRNNSNHFQLLGDQVTINSVAEMLQQLYAEAQTGQRITADNIHLRIQQCGLEQRQSSSELGATDINIRKRTSLSLAPLMR